MNKDGRVTMKNKRALYAAIILFTFMGGVLSAQGHINLTNTPDMSELPFVLALPNGQVMALWTEGHFNGWGVIWYRILTPGQGWSQAKIAADKIYSAAFPQLDIDQDGEVHMAYMDGCASGNREIYYKKFTNGKWTTPERVGYSPGLNSSWPRIAVEGNRIYVLWCHNHTSPSVTNPRLDIVLMEKNDGGTFPSAYQNVSQLSNSVSVHPFFDVHNGNVYAAWMDDNHAKSNWNIYYNDRIGGNWGNSIRLYPDFNQYTPALTVDPSGVVHVIYANKGNPVWYQQKNSSGWTPRIEISTGKTTVQSMLFMTYKMGYLHAVWRQRDGDGDYIHYARGSTSGNWEPPIKVSHGGESEYPGIDVDKNGTVHVVYSDIGVGGNRDVFYVSLDQVLSYPVASFTLNPDKGNPPLEVQFDASGSYDPDGQLVSYDWDFGDGGTGTGVTASHTYSQQGNFTATLTVTDNESQSSSSSKEIVVGTPPHAVISAGPTSGPSPLVVEFDASASYDEDGYIKSYHWNFGDGTQGSGVTTTHKYTNEGTRTATLTVTDDTGLTGSSSIEIEITDNRTPVARFVRSPQQGPAPLKVNFDASGSNPSDQVNGHIVTYKWDFGDGANGAGVKTSHTYKKAGDFTVTLEITDDNGSKDSATKDVSVFIKPVARFSMSPSEGVVPLTVKFDGSSSSDEDGSIRSYKWYFGDGTVGWGKVVKHQYHTGGDKKVTLQVTDNDGWCDKTEKSLSLIDRPFPPDNPSVQKVINEGLFFSDYINILRWKQNPKNTGKIKPVRYHIYRREKGGGQDFVYLDTIPFGTFRYDDVLLEKRDEMENYIYGVRAVDANNRQSDLRKVDAASSGSAGYSITAVKEEEKNPALKNEQIKK
jgi:PKD repeat protein